MLHLYAALAQKERALIAERTKAALAQKKAQGAVLMCDAVQYEGKLWLVPEWTAFPAERIQKPVRIISLDGLTLGPVGPQYRADFALQNPMTKDVLAGRGTTASPVVIEGPDLSVPLPPEGLN
jgi:hypothetical protein